jgi:hypothetical protein
MKNILKINCNHVPKNKQRLKKKKKRKGKVQKEN